MARRGGFRSVPNFAVTLLSRMAIEAAGRGAMPLATADMFGRHAEAMPAEEEEADMFRDEIAEMFGEYTDAEAPQYGERTKRTRRTEYW